MTAHIQKCAHLPIDTSRYQQRSTRQFIGDETPGPRQLATESHQQRMAPKQYRLLSGQPGRVGIDANRVARDVTSRSGGVRLHVREHGPSQCSL
jgi:hypothetical protein